MTCSRHVGASPGDMYGNSEFSMGMSHTEALHLTFFKFCRSVMVMQTEQPRVSSWSGKAKQSLKHGPIPYQRLPPGIYRAPGVDPNALPRKGLPGSLAPESQTIVNPPKAAQPSEKSCIGSISSDGSGSIKSGKTHPSGRPSSASASTAGARSHATEEEPHYTHPRMPPINHFPALQ